MSDEKPAEPSVARPEWVQRLAIVGSIAALALLVLGIVMLAGSKHGGSVVFAVGLVGLLLYGAMIPLSRRNKTL